MRNKSAKGWQNWPQACPVGWSLFWSIFEFLRGQGLIWFEINKKKNISKFQVSISILTCAAQQCKFPNIGFLALNYEIFYSGQSNCLQNLKLCRLYSYNSNYPSEFLQIFIYYNFEIYNLLTLRYNSILSSCNSKIIIAKNL